MHPICQVWLQEHGWLEKVPFFYQRDTGWFRANESDSKIQASKDELIAKYNAPLSTEIHHVNKRRGEMLNDERFWLAVCRIQEPRQDRGQQEMGEGARIPQGLLMNEAAEIVLESEVAIPFRAVVDTATGNAGFCAYGVRFKGHLCASVKSGLCRNRSYSAQGKATRSFSSRSPATGTTTRRGRFRSRRRGSSPASNALARSSVPRPLAGDFKATTCCAGSRPSRGSSETEP